MIGSRHSLNTIVFFAKNIRDLVESGETNWNELGFTEKDLEGRIRDARVRNAKKEFANMLDACYSLDTIVFFAKNIRDLVESGETNWEELGFTDKDVTERLKKFQTSKAA